MRMRFPASNHLEKFTAVFAIGFALLIWLASGRTSASLGALALNAGVAAIALFVLPPMRGAKNPVIVFFGIALPLFLFLVFYRETAIVFNRPEVIWHDSTVSSFEGRLWRVTGNDHHPLLGDWLAFSYIAYVPILVAATAILMVGHSRGTAAPAESNVRRICLCLAICYLIFVTYPVMGPRFSYPEFQAPRMGTGIFTSLAVLNQDHGMLRGAAFPSAHVAAIAVVFLSLWNWKRVWFWILLPLGINLVLGAVYLAYHYVADAVAGLVVGVLAVVLDRRWVRNTKVS